MYELEDVSSAIRKFNPLFIPCNAHFYKKARHRRGICQWRAAAIILRPISNSRYLKNKPVLPLHIC